MLKQWPVRVCKRGGEERKRERREEGGERKRGRREDMKWLLI
jgi:hypothetical protein